MSELELLSRTQLLAKAAEDTLLRTLSRSRIKNDLLATKL